MDEDAASAGAASINIIDSDAAPAAGAAARTSAATTRTGIGLAPPPEAIGRCTGASLAATDEASVGASAAAAETAWADAPSTGISRRDSAPEMGAARLTSTSMRRSGTGTMPAPGCIDRSAVPVEGAEASAGVSIGPARFGAAATGTGASIAGRDGGLPASPGAVADRSSSDDEPSDDVSSRAAPGADAARLPASAQAGAADAGGAATSCSVDRWIGASDPAATVGDGAS